MAILPPVPLPTTDLSAWALKTANYLQMLEAIGKQPSPKVIQLERKQATAKATMDGLLMFDPSGAPVYSRDGAWKFLLGSDAASGDFVKKSGDTMTGPLTFSGPTTPIKLQGPDASNVYMQWLNANLTERGAVYATAANAMVFRNRAGTGGTVSYLQLNADGSSLLGGVGGLTAASTITCDGGSGWGLKIVSGYPAIWFHDDNVGGAYEHLALSAGSGWWRFGVADASGGITADVLTINPAGTVISQPPVVANRGLTAISDAGQTWNIRLQSGYPTILFEDTTPSGEARFGISGGNGTMRFGPSDAAGGITPWVIWSPTVANFTTLSVQAAEGHFGPLGIGIDASDNYIRNEANAFIGFGVNAVTANSGIGYYFRDSANTTMAAVYGPGTSSPSPTAVITREKGDLRYAAASSRRYKERIADIDEQELVDAFDRLVLKQWTWGGEVPVGDERHGTRGVGVIAEDLVQIFAPAVRSRWVQPPEPQPTEDGTEPPEVVATEKIPDATDPNALISVLAAKIRWLERRLATLEAA